MTEGYKEHYQEKESLAEFIASTTAVSSGGTILDKFAELKKSWEIFRNIFLIGGIVVILAILGLVGWGYNTWFKVEQSSRQSMESARKVQDLILEEQNLRKSVEQTIQNLQKQPPLADEQTITPNSSVSDSASSTAEKQGK